jgi:hypothetical protein
MLHKNLKPEEIQKFIKKHRLTECFEVDGMFFRVRANAESHCRRNKIDAGKIVTHAKAEVEKKKTDKTV